MAEWEAHLEDTMANLIILFEFRLSEVQRTKALVSQQPRHSDFYDRVFPKSRAALKEAESREIIAELAELEEEYKELIEDTKSDMKQPNDNTQAA